MVKVMRGMEEVREHENRRIWLRKKARQRVRARGGRRKDDGLRVPGRFL